MSDSSEASYLRSQGPKPKKTKYGIYVQDISKEKIESVFCYPAEEACVKLGICLTILKRLCRKFGIPRWPYRRLKCTIKPKDAHKKTQQPEVQQQKQPQQEHHQRARDALPASPSINSDELTTSQRQRRRTDRPQRHAALDVQKAVVRAKADINDNEIATVVVAPRNGKNSDDATTAAAKGIAPRVPDPSAEDLAYQSMSTEESQALSVLLGGMGRDPSVAAAKAVTVMAGIPGEVANALIDDHTPGLIKPEAKDAIPASPQQQQQQEEEEGGMNSNPVVDSNLLKSMELAMQMHFVAEQQRQHQAATAAMAAFAAAANAPSTSTSGQQQQLQNAQNVQTFAAMMQTMSNMNAPQDASAAMLARLMVDSFSASAASMPPWMAPFYNPQAAAAAAAAAWNVNGATPPPAVAAPNVGKDTPC